ncbi:hypothetical protein AMECASPLE_037825 [Ameca splendens]|uniref:Uncharacterized protein n=1 Tax=Ameca splendens TaxID=208324 RepID=A0ABV0ZGS4_9TELE
MVPPASYRLTRGGLASLFWGWPSQVPRGVTWPPGTCRRVPTQGLAPGLGLSFVVPGDVTCLDLLDLMKASETVTGPFRFSTNPQKTNFKCLNAETSATLTPSVLCFSSRLSPEERAQVEAQLDELTTTYNQLLDSSNQQLQQLEQQLAKEEERKVDRLKMIGLRRIGSAADLWQNGALFRRDLREMSARFFWKHVALSLNTLAS